MSSSSAGPNEARCLKSAVIPKDLATYSEPTNYPTMADVAQISLEDQLLLKLAKLMEGGEEDEDTCKTLDAVTALLNEEAISKLTTEKPLHELIDLDAFETILSYMDMRQGPIIRGHATLTVSEFLKASEQTGTQYLHQFFAERVGKGTYDDYIVAFSVAASIFPIVPNISADLFLSEGFVNSLGTLMKRKWKSKKVEQACLEMLNAACMNTPCRESIQKYCTEWLEEIVNEAPKTLNALATMEQDPAIEDGPMQQRVHSLNVRNLAAVILAKIQV